MDRRVKERLIGASILVALIVLVAPELLSGSKSSSLPEIRPAIAPEATRNVTLDLATSKAPASSGVEPAETQVVPASAVSAVHGGEAAAPPAITSASSGSPAAPPSAAPVETMAPSPISSRAGWAVQLGSFASRSNADNLSRQLKGQGFSVYVLPGGAGTSVRYRVRVGPLADRDSAERTAAKLKSIGHVSSLVAPAG